MKLNRYSRKTLTAFLLSFLLVITLTPIVQSKVPPLTPMPGHPGNRGVGENAATTEIAQTFGNFDNNRYQKLLQADQFYKQGNLQMAATLQRQVKPDFPPAEPPPPPLADDDNLPPAGRVYLRNARRGIEQELESKTLVSLKLLTENYPDYIPGHLLYVQTLKKYERNEEALAALDRVITLYPDQTELLDAKIELLGEEKRWLEAAIAARQFTFSYPDRPEATKYRRLADENQQQYDKYIRQELIGLGLGVAIQSELFGDEGNVQLIEILLQGEVKAGEIFAEQEKQQVTLLDNSKVQQYVNEVGQKVAKLMGRDEFEYEFNVIDEPSLNAFAYPGGKIFINSGMLKLMGSEAELAGLLGHEIAHSVLSHGFQELATNAALSGFKLIPFANILTEYTSFEYSRELETQSDILGTRVLATAGYSADGLHSVMGILKQQNSSSTIPWNSSHPAPAERVRYLEELIQNSGYNRYAYEGVEAYRANAGT
ncbi:MAG: M48 family metalloprotease [Prochloron sp. SP5CPC1]|nr:M48 family metalloprotease [Candidatus Paraprochloron terpiosi SP5CPC1]